MNVATSPKIDCARDLARRYPSELMHMEQVALLAEKLFQLFRKMHRLGTHERDLLVCAALLHDIGLTESSKGHHKKGMKMIIAADLPALTADERDLVAQIARYHRKAVPSDRHEAFRSLTPAEQGVVRALAPLLRLADGLDRAHENAVTHIAATFSDPATDCRLDLYGGGDLAYAAWGARRKAEWFEETYQIRLQLEPRGPVPPKG
jgi:exopolyphosphatase / guanosine-5'-triphosphate,3'-diphosphate pyrophosphatase